MSCLVQPKTNVIPRPKHSQATVGENPLITVNLCIAVVAVLCALTNGAAAAGEASPRQRAYPPKRPVDRSAEPIKIAFISYANPQQVARDAGVLAAYLEPFVGVTVKGFVTLDYGSTIETMRGNNVDLATIDPLAFMMAHERIGAKPLLLEIYSSGAPTYHSCIWVRRDSGIESLESLKGRTIAFADQVDMSGHLLPREIFVQKGLLIGTLMKSEYFQHVYFAGGDEQAIRAVLNGFVDAAGISQYGYLLLRPRERDKVTTIARSIESPAHLLMARKDLDDQICDRIKQALLALDPSRPCDKKLLDKLYGVQGYAEAKLSDFGQVAKIAARYGFLKTPELFAAKGAPISREPKDANIREASEHLNEPLTSRSIEVQPADASPINAACPFSGKPINPTARTVTYKGNVYGFCCNRCVGPFNRNPQRAIAMLKDTASK